MIGSRVPVFTISMNLKTIPEGDAEVLKELEDGLYLVRFDDGTEAERYIDHQLMKV